MTDRLEYSIYYSENMYIIYHNIVIADFMLNPFSILWKYSFDQKWKIRYEYIKVRSCYQNLTTLTDWIRSWASYFLWKKVLYSSCFLACFILLRVTSYDNFVFLFSRKRKLSNYYLYFEFFFFTVHDCTIFTDSVFLF